MDTVDWRQARQWLIDTGVIPPTHRVTKPDVTLIDFARSLRDGVFLCSLLNKLKTGSVKYTARPVMQHSYLNNINAFLSACEQEFKISPDDLFTDSELYDVDNFSKVMSTLSKLSYTQEALSRGWKPFPSDENRDYYNDPAASNGEDIYASLQDMSAQTAVYANISDLYQDTFNDDETFGYGDEKIYDSVLRYQATKPITDENTQDEQRLAILKELYETEKSFSEVLRVIAKDYSEVLKDHCNDDLRVLFSASQKLLPSHEQLRDSLEKCANPKPNIPETDVGNCFFEVETGLLEYGVYAAVLPQATEKAKALQNQRDTGRLMQGIMERSPQSRFPLSDILPVPIQRIMRYPLLIKELEKCAKKASQQTQLTQLEQLMNLLEDIAKYINITKGDYDTVKTIEELEANLTEYKGPKLSQCGRYHSDGELKMKAVDKENEPKSRWVFLFDKIILVTTRRQRFTSTRYAVKAYHEVVNMTVEPVANIRRASQHAFRLKMDSKGNDTAEYIAYAKNEQLKSMWTDSIKKARDIICPKAGKSRHHSFEYYNFDTAKKCSFCQRLLLGSYFQGYLCTECGAISHRDCLGRQMSCSAVRHPRVPGHPALLPQGSLDTGMQRWNSRSRSNGPETMQIAAGARKTYVATQKFGAFGHRRDTYLSFDKGDEIDIINNSDFEKWEGILLRNNTRGFVSPHYLIRKPQVAVASPTPSPRPKQMSDYAWYIGRKTRIDAEVALHRQRDGVFLIRESMDRPGEYAVALRWNNMPKHIKIMKNSQTEKLYVSDACDFDSIPDLVEYYHKNTLGQSFPGVDTTLRYPYLDVMEGRVNFSQSRHHSLTSNSTGLPPPNFPAPTPHGGHIPPPTMSPPSHSHSIGGSWSNDMSGGVTIGEAVCDFNGESQGHLSFSKHDTVKVLNRDTKKLGWWFGECNGRTGLFRADHIYIKDELR